MREPMCSIAGGEIVPFSKAPSDRLRRWAAGDFGRLANPEDGFDIDFRRRWAAIVLSERVAQP